jgi:hypothetical protein
MMQSPDIRDQIREYAERLDTEISPVRFDDLKGPSAIPSREPLRQRKGLLRGLVVAVGSASAVLVLIGGSTVLLGVISGEPGQDPNMVPATVATSPPATTRPSTATIVSPIVPPAISPTSWTRVDTEMAARSVAAGPNGFVAIETSGSPEALLWSSADMTTWSSQVIPDNPGIDATITSVVYGGPGYVAFGGHWGIDIRFSTDGIEWVLADHIDAGTYEQTPSGDPAPGTYGSIEAITYGNSHYVAVGDVRDQGDESYSNPRAAVWTSSDGLTWIGLPQDDDVFNGPWHQQMFDVAFGPAGFVAVGSTEGDDGMSSVGAIWHSPNGFTWTRIAHDDDLFGEHTPDEWLGLTDVVHGDDGYVAIGTEGILMSVDGLTWTRVSVDELNGDLGFDDIAYGDGTYLLIGTEWSQNSDGITGQANTIAIWYSSDAISWERVPNNDGALGDPVDGTIVAPQAAVFSDSRFVVVGFDQLWPPDPAGPPIHGGHLWIGETTS